MNINDQINTDDNTPGKVSNPPKLILSRTGKIYLIIIGLIMLGMVIMIPNFVREYGYGILMRKGIYIPDEAFKMTNIGASSESSHTYTIYNLRGTKLHIDIKPSCGCIGVSIHKGDIASYGRLSFTARMNISKQQSNEEKSILIHTDSADQPYLFVYFVD